LKLEREFEARKKQHGLAGNISLHFFEKIFESLARIGGTRRGGRRRSGGGGLRVGSGRGVFFYGHTKFIKSAVIFCVLGSNALRDGLGALKLNARIKKAALLAGVELELAFRARTVGVEARRQHRPAICATPASYRTYHSRCAWPKLIGAARSAGRRFAAMMNFFFLVLLFRVAITAVAVLSIHGRLRLSVSTDYC
jgi:hypothetical protein